MSKFVSIRQPNGRGSVVFIERSQKLFPDAKNASGLRVIISCKLGSELYSYLQVAEYVLQRLELSRIERRLPHAY